jgi:hypothetical protein
MNDNVENLILEQLKGFRNEFRDFRSKYDQDISDVKQRLTTLERGFASLKHESADQYDQYIRQQLSIDQIKERIEKIERRLDIVN